MAKISMSVNGKEKKVSNAFKNAVLGQPPSYIITEAKIKDEFCFYSFEILEGIGAGDTHNVKGVGIIKPDMSKAFNKLNVHMAVIDDVFKHSGIEIEDIDNYHSHDLTTLFEVTGIKIKGSKGNESVILIGTKYVSAGGIIDVTSPKIPMNNLSSYKWYNELKEAVDDVRHEVSLYREGKYTPVEVEKAENAQQMTIADQMDNDLMDEHKI